MNKVITISRQYGSGGHVVGKKLAEAFDIPFYDNEIINLAAKESGYAVKAFEKAEEKATNSFLYSIAMGMGAYSNQDFGYASLSIDDRIFLAQSNIIRKVAEEGPCVIVGRCADYVLKERNDVVDVFVSASLDYRIQRAIEYYQIPKEKAAETVLRNDKRRANYYNFHANEKWGNVMNYDLSVRTDFGGIDHAVKCIKAFIEV
ncbi:MAG: cytidylate kinase-like family protein [Clostridium sp.]|nr:cytidylate kinase-like family protein [Clostridium sp.]